MTHADSTQPNKSQYSSNENNTNNDKELTLSLTNSTGAYSLTR